MSSKCRICGSYAINPHRHGREPNTDLDLCDVCYWRTRAEESIALLCDLVGDWPVAYASDVLEAARAYLKNHTL